MVSFAIFVILGKSILPKKFYSIGHWSKYFEVDWFVKFLYIRTHFHALKYYLQRSPGLNPITKNVVSKAQIGIINIMRVNVSGPNIKKDICSRYYPLGIAPIVFSFDLLHISYLSLGNSCSDTFDEDSRIFCRSRPSWHSATWPLVWLLTFDYFILLCLLPTLWPR